MMISMNSIRRREDGSIDIDFYAALGNRERSRMIKAVIARLFRAAKPPAPWVVVQPRASSIDR